MYVVRRCIQGGFAISDEMCLNYIHYYPLVDLEVCKSSVMTDSLYDFFRFLRQYVLPPSYHFIRRRYIGIHKKLSYRWQTARRLCTRQSAAFHAVLSRATFWWMTAIYWPDLPTSTHLSLIRLSRWGGSHRAIGFIFDMEKLDWLGYNLVKIAWWSTQSFGHNTSTWQTHRQPSRHSKCRVLWKGAYFSPAPTCLWMGFCTGEGVCPGWLPRALSMSFIEGVFCSWVLFGSLLMMGPAQA